MAHKCVFILATLATSGAFAVPLNSWHGELASAACASSCPAYTDTKFSFETGQTYEYRYETDVQTTVGGASEEQSSLHMRSTVQLEVLSRCELVLKLTEVSLQDSNPSQYESRQHVERTSEFKAALQQNDLRFAYLDGEVENICPQQEEPSWVLNIKRGILSTLQNSMDALDTDKRLFEKDVAGNCPTEYESQGKTWSTRKVRKTKDIIGCLDRSGPHSAFTGTPFTSESDIQSLPVMKSTHVCEQEINSAGIISLSECKESHVFRPFSRHDNGARTEVTSKLTFYRQISSVTSRDGPVRSQMSLTFDHTLSEAETEENVREAKITLSDLCTASADDIRPELPALFTKFIRTVRRLDTNDLSRLFGHATNGICPKAEKFFRDAIPMIGTTASVNLIRELIESNRVEDLESEIWLTSISTSITRPSKDMITALKPLLSRDPSRKTYLTVSSLVNNYCRLNADCDTDSDVQEIVGVFEEKLRYNCRVESDEQHEIALMALKALGNTGHAARSAASLLRCANNAETNMALRVSALQAFRRMPCMADRSELFNILDNTETDSELRIQAYITLMACPDLATINRVRTLLENEQINQVGSFIWTHLTNLMETHNPLKQEIREILEHEELSKAFDLDKRKFSRNMEWSLFSELINMGGSAESNLIWSQDSYLPRSAALNLTVDMFGKSMNLFEFGTRMEGMEEMLEKVFGPGSDISNALRQKRAAATDDSINSLNSRYNLRRDDPQISYFLRLFGNEIRYGDLHNFDTTGLQDKINFLEFLINLANDHDFEITKSIMFLDVAHTIPTIAGMPLKLEADGSAAINMHVRGKMDIRRMFTSPSHFDIEGSISPSAALEVTSQMGVDAHVARTGLKMVSTLHTSTVLQGKVQLKEGRELEIDFDVPRDQMEIFSAQSKFFVVWREDEREQNMLTNTEANNVECVGGSFTRVFGIELCGELSYPYDTSRTETPFFPLTGPTAMKVYLNKRETYTGFHFETKYIQQKERVDSKVQITDVAKIQFNTPESQIDRELSMEFTYNRGTHDLTFNLKTPWKKAEITSVLEDTPTMKSFTLTGVIDESQTYSLTAQMPISERNNAVQYEPTIVLAIPERRDIRLEGEVVIRPGRKYDVDFRLRNVVEEPIRVKGSLDKLDNSRRMKYATELEISSSLLQSKIEGFIDNNRASGNSIAARVELEYRYASNPQQRLVFSNKMRNRSTDSRCDYSLDTAWSTTMFPRYNGEVGVTYTREAGVVNTNIQAGFDDTRKVTITQTATYTIGQNTQVTGDARFQFPLKNMDYQLTVSHEHNPSRLNSQASIRCAENNEGSLSILLNKESMKPLKMNGEINLHYPGREMSWTQSIDEQTPGNYHHNLAVQLQKYQTITLTSVYTMAARHDFTATLDIPDMSPMSVTAHLAPVLRNIEAGIQVTALERTYSTSYSHSVTGTTAQFTAEVEGAVAWPERHITSTTTVSRRGQDFSGSLETSWAEGKTVTVTAQTTLSKTAPSTTLRVTWPDNFVNVAVQGNIKHQGWYNTEDDMEGSMRFTSSIAGYEQITASLKHDITTTTTRSEAEVSWAQNKKIDITYDFNKVNGYSSVQGSLQVNTPFGGYNTMRGELRYNLEGNGMTGRVMASKENENIVFESEGEMNIGRRNSVRGTASLTSTFMDRISVSATHNDDGSQYDTQVQTSWAPNKQVSAQFNMRHQNNRKLANNAELTILTPFEVMRQGKVSWSHEHTDKKIITQVEIEKDGQKGTFEIDAMHKVNNKLNRRMLQLTSNLQTPFENFEDLHFELSHQHNKDDWQNVKTEVSTRWDESNRITYVHEIDITRRQANIKGTFTSPFTGPISVDLENEFLRTQMTMNNVVTYNNEPQLSLTGDGRYADEASHANFHWTSTCPYLRDITLGLTYNLENGIHRTQHNLQYAPGKQIILDFTLGMEDVKQGSIRLRTPFEYIRDGSLSTRFTGNQRTFESTTELAHNMLDRNVAVTLQADTTNLEDMSVEFDFQGPRQYFVKSTVSHNKNAAGRMQNTATFEIPQYQGRITNTMTIQGWNRHNTDTVIEYMAGKRIQITSAFQTTPTVEGQISLTSDCEMLRNAVLRFTHEGQLRNYQATAAVTYNDVTISGEHSFELTGSSLTTSATLQTPFPNVNTINMQVTHSGQLQNFENNVVVSYNGRQMRGSSQFTLNADGPSGNFQITTPYEMLRTLSMNFAHVHRNSVNFENNAQVVYNDNRYSGNSELRWFGKTFRSKVVLSIPDEYSIKVNSKGDWSDCANTVIVKLADETINANANLKYGAELLETSASLTTTFEGYDNFEVSLNHAGPVDNFSTSFNLVTPFEAVSRQGFELTHQGSLNNFQCSLRINTPFAALPTALFTVNHEGTIARFSTRATSEHNGKTVSGEISFNAVDAISGNARLTTSYAGHDNYVASFTHSPTTTGFRTTATVETPYANYQRFHATYDHTANLRGFECQGTVESRYPGFESINLEISHSLPRQNNMVSSFVLRSSHTGYSRLSASVNHDGNFVTMTSSAVVETPFAAVPRVSYSINHDISNINRIRSDVQAATPVGEFSFNVAHTGDKQSFTTNVVSTSPFQNYQRYSVNIVHTARSLSDITNNLEITTPMGNFGHAFRHQGIAANFQTTEQITTPFTGYERYALSVEHDASDLTNIRTSSQLNTPHGDASYSLTHTGTINSMRSNLEILTPFANYNRFVLAVAHNHADLKNIQSSATFTSVLGDIAYEFSHTGDLSNMESSLSIRTPFTGYETTTITKSIAYTDCTNFRTNAEARTPFGVFSYRVTHNGNHLRLDDSLQIATPFSGYEQISASIQHNAEDYKNIRSTAQINSPFGDASYTVNSRGDLDNMESTAEVTLPITGYERWTVNSQQAIVSKSSISSSMQVGTPFGRFTYRVSHNGGLRNMRTDATITTPFSAVSQLSFDLQNNVRSWTEFSSEATVGTPSGEFAYNLNHNGDLKTMTSSLTINTPYSGYERFSANIDNNIESWTSVRSTATVGTHLGEFSYTLNHNGDLKTMTSALTVSTPFSGYERLAANVENNIVSWTRMSSTANIGGFSYALNHNGDLKTMTSSLTVTTPFAGYERFTASIDNNIVSYTNIRSTARVGTPIGDFSYNVNHNGDYNRLTNEVEITTPFTGFENMGFTINHEAPTWKIVKTNGRIRTHIGEFVFSVDHDGDLSRMEHTTEVTTPFTGYERFGIVINHNAQQLTNIRSSGHVNTHVGRFTYSLTHTGSLTNMRSNAEVGTPFAGHERYTLSVENNIRSKTDFSSTATFGAPLGDFSYTINHNGDLKTMTSSLAITTPFSGYERFSANIGNNIASWTNIRSTATVGTPIGEFNYNLNHNGDLKTMTSSLAITTPFSGYERFSANIDNSIVSWTNIGSTATIGTPLGDFTYTINHNGNLKTMRSSLTVSTPFSGYERFSANIENNIASWTDIRSTATFGGISYNLNHNGDLKTMRSSLTVNTPYSRYESFSANIENNIASWTNIRSTATVGTPIGEFNYNLNHNGDLKTMTSSLTVSTPFSGYERFSANIENNIASWTNIGSTATVGTPIGEFSYTLNHNGDLKTMTSSLIVNTPFGGISTEVNNNIRSSSDIRSTARLVTPVGAFSYNVEHSGSPRDFTHSSEVTTPFTGYERMSLVITHASPSAANIRSSGRLSTPYGEATYNLQHTGNMQNMQSSLVITTPFSGYERLGTSLSLNAADLSNVVFSNTFITPKGDIEYGFTFTGVKNNFRCTFEATTPFEGYRRFTGSLEHNHRNLRDITTSAVLNTPFGDFTANFNHEGVPQNFRSSITVTTPIQGYERYSINFDNNCEDKTNLNTALRMSIPTGNFAATIAHTGSSNNFRSSLTIETPFANANRYEAVFAHSHTDRTNIVNSFTLTTPRESYGYSLNHNGNLQSFTTDLDVNTPFPGARNVQFNLQHAARNLKNIETSARITTPRGNFGMSLEHSKAQNNIRTSMQFTTPFENYDRFGLALTHSGLTVSGLNSDLQLTTPLGNYGYTVRHEGTAKEFQNTITIVTPYDRFNRISITTMLSASSLNNLRSSMTIETPAGPFGYSISHVGNKAAFQCSAEITTPFAPYNTFSGSLEYNYAESITTSAVITTTVPGYERFSTEVTVQPNPENFQLGITAQTSIEGYSRFSFQTEFTGGLQTPQLLVIVQTPISGYESFRLTMGKTGPLRNLQGNAQLQSSVGNFGLSYSQRINSGIVDIEAAVETSISGYERFSFEVNMENKKRMRASIEIDTPFANYRQFRARLVHGTKGNTMRSSLNVNTPFAGYEEFSASLNHENERNGFNTDARVSTPINGYRNFGLSLAHTGDIEDFQVSGTLNLPFERLPEVTARVTHRGNRFDFANAVSVQYNSKTVTVNTAFRKASGTYEGSLEINTPYRWIRDLRVTGNHNRNGDLKTGSLDVTHNGEQKVDFDYSYTTSAVKNINIEIRRPYPMATQVNLGGQTNDATINWDTTARDQNVHLEFNYQNQNNQKEAAFTLNLPHRTVGFTFSLTNTAERIAQSTTVMWNNLPETRISYQLEMNKSTRRSQQLYDGQFALESPLGDFQATFNHRGTPGTQYSTDIAVQSLTVRSSMVKSGDKYTHTLSATHSILPPNTQLVIERTHTDRVTEGKVEVSFDNQVITYTGRIADESSYGTTLYTANTRLTHAASNLDFQWNGEVRSDSESYQGNMETSYLTSYDLQRKTASLRAQIQKLRREISVELVTPVKSVTVNARDTSNGQGVHSFEASMTSADCNMRGELIVNAPEKSITIKALRDEDNYIQAYAGMRTSRQALVEVFRMAEGTKHDIAVASVSLLEDQLVSTRFFLCPRLSSELKNIYSNLGNNAAYLRFPTEVFRTEFTAKKAQMIAAVQTLRPIYEAISSELSAMKTQAGAILRQMYNDNHFYMRTTHEFASRHYDNVSRKVQEHIVLLGQHWQTVRYHLDNTWSHIRQVFTDEVAIILTKVAHLAKTFYPYVSDLIVNARSIAMRLYETIQNNPTLRWLWNKWQSFDIETLKEPIFAARDYIMGHYTAQVEKVKAWIAYANSFPQTRYIVAHIKRVYQRSKFAVEYMEIMQRMKHLIYELHQINLDTYRADLVEKVRDYLQLERTRWTIWNPEEGEIGFDLYWPFHWDDLKHLPRLQDYISSIDLTGYFRNIRAKIVRHMPTLELSLYDFYYKYKPSSDVFDWVPPFKTRAAVIGDQHYMTFDKKFYEFAGECKYLLAHDFIDGVFSVAVNYRNTNQGVTRRSITVFSNDKQVEVFTDARVKLDGTLVEMPLTFQNTTITRNGHVIRVDNTKGVTVDCHLAQNRCTVNVTGWYFAKTAGLFGTYNNEPADDLTTSDKRITSDVAEFANSWAMKSRCRAVNNARTVTASPDTQQYRVCAALFQSPYSSLRPCFKVVDPAPLMDMCINDIQTTTPTEQDTCRVASFYVEECRNMGVPVRVPKTCVRCEVESMQTEVTEGQNITLRGDNVPQSADVVFVLEHARCNRELLGMITTSVDDLNTAFLKSGIRRNRFAIVGYGAEGVLNAPHVHTMDGEIFNTHDKIRNGLENFERESAAATDVFSALRYASKLPFRVGVSKTIVLVPCSNCTEETVRYGEMQQSFKKLGIHLHVLMPHTFELAKDKEIISAYIFGADRDHVYTRRDSSTVELEGDRELRQQLMVPKELCAALAMETEGSVFNTLKWTESRPFMQKTFVDVLVRLIAKKGRPDDCQNCDCVADETGVGKTVCNTCESIRSFFDFLPGFGESYENSAEISRESSEETTQPDFSFEETTPNPRRVRNMKRGGKRRNRKQKAQ